MAAHLPYNPSVPLYYQLARLVRMRIESGTISSDGRLPSEQALGQEFGVSRTTIRQALGLLKAQGFLSGRRGAGTFVAERRGPGLLVRASGDPLHHGLGTKVQIVSIETVPAPGRVARFVRLPPEAEVLRVTRVHRLAGEPLSAVITYLPPELAPVITRQNLQRASLHELLWRMRGLALGRSVHTLRVQRADETVARLLGVPLMDPVLYIQSEGYLDTGQPIRLTDNFFREDRYQYTAEMRWTKPGSAGPSPGRAVGGGNHRPRGRRRGT
jgi:GntR family transcriptional regulator